MIELSLFGPRAQEFDGDTVYEVGRKSHVIAIFVGTSMKQYKGSPPFLSGTAACRWYIILTSFLKWNSCMQMVYQ